MVEIPLFKSWAEDNIEPCTWERKKYKNYCAVVTLNDDGKEERTYFEISKERDLFFQFKDVKVGDIIVASCWNVYKCRQSKLYYIVEKITADIVQLSDPYTTYRKAYKSLHY